MKYTRGVLLVLVCSIFCIQSLSAKLTAKIKTVNPEPQEIALKSSQWVLTKPFSLPMLAKKASIIFNGQLLTVTELIDEKTKLAVRAYEFKVKDYIKDECFNQEHGKKLVLREWAGIKSPLVSDVKSGKNYVFFFNKISEAGLTSLLGMEQGLVKFNKTGQPVLATHIKNSSVANVKALTNSNAPSVIADELNSYDDLKQVCTQYIKEAQ